MRYFHAHKTVQTMFSASQAREIPIGTKDTFHKPASHLHIAEFYSFSKAPGREKVRKDRICHLHAHENNLTAKTNERTQRRKNGQLYPKKRTSLPTANKSASFVVLSVAKVQVISVSRPVPMQNPTKALHTR